MTDTEKQLFQILNILSKMQGNQEGFIEGLMIRLKSIDDALERIELKRKK